MRRIKHTAVVPLVVFALMAGCNHTTNPTTPEQQTSKTEQTMNDVQTL